MDYLAYQLLFCLFLSPVVMLEEFGEQTNQCEMTYMWRRMHFMDVDFGNESSRYSLFLYGEGLYAEKFSKIGELTGLPVIFVPGTAGSGKQVRSLGSMLQNKTDLRKTSFHFDTFAVDFNEELTAISSKYLVKQSQYLSASIEYVWGLYTKKPTGIILVGHSMGGIVIQKYVLLHPDFDRNKISMIISLATPYNEPPYFFDKSIFHLWLTLNHKNEQYVKSGTPHVPLVSISGGLKDEFIEEDWTDSQYHLHVSTTSIDKVNLEMDHKCIIWCNQLVRQISRVLFDYAEKPDIFIKKADQNMRLHFEGPGSILKPLVVSDPQIFNLRDCLPQCPSIGMLLLTVDFTIIGQPFVLVLSNNTSINLVDVNCPATALSCPVAALTRFLSNGVLYSFLKLDTFPHGSVIKVKLEDTKTWVLDGPTMPKKSLSFTEIASEAFYISSQSLISQDIFVNHGLAVLPIEFVHNGKTSSIVYKVYIEGNDCKTKGIRRVVFFQDNHLIKMSEVDGHGNPTSITIYKSENGGKDAMIVFINEFGCHYKAYFRVDYGYTIIKAIRRYRHVIPLSVIIIITGLCAASQTSFNYAHYFWLCLIISFSVGKFGEAVPVILLADSTIISAFYLLFRLLLIPVLKFLKSVEWLTMSALQKLVLLTVVIAFSLFTHSLFISITCGFLNLLSMVDGRISKFGSLFPQISLQMLVIILQIPSFIIYFWDLKAYGQIYAEADPFFEANTLVLLFCISETSWSTLKKPLPPKYSHLLKIFGYFFTSILQLSCCLCLFLVTYRDGIYSFQVLDDLCIVCATILAFLRRPGAVTYLNKDC